MVSVLNMLNSMDPGKPPLPSKVCSKASTPGEMCPPQNNNNYPLHNKKAIESDDYRKSRKQDEAFLPKWSGMLTMRRLRKRRKKLAGAFDSEGMWGSGDLPAKSSATSFTGALDSLVTATTAFAPRAYGALRPSKTQSKSLADVYGAHRVSIYQWGGISCKIPQSVFMLLILELTSGSCSL